MNNQPEIKEVSYSISSYPQVAKETANQLKASWNDTNYRLPENLGLGMIEAYDLKDSSAMIAIFNLNNEISVRRVASSGKPKLLVDIILSGFSPLSFDSDRDVKRLGYHIYLSTNRLNVSANLPEKIQHEQICFEMDAQFINSNLNLEFCDLLEKEFFISIEIPDMLDGLISSILISQDESSRLNMIHHNLNLLLEKLSAILLDRRATLFDKINDSELG